MTAYANRHNAKRDEVEPAIVDALRKAGASVILMDKPVDLLVGVKNRMALAEVKTGDAKLNDNQIKFQGEWKGPPFVILRTPEEALEWLKVLKQSESSNA